MLPQDDIPDIVFVETDQRTRRRVWLVVALIVMLVIGCGLWPREAGAAKRPQPVRCAVVSEVETLTEGLYRANVNGQPRLLTPRSTRAPWLRPGRYCPASELTKRFEVR